MYKTFIEAVDAVDNGINQYVSDAPPLYVNNTTLGARVSRLNPAWNETPPPGVTANADLDERFRAAMALTGQEFEEAVRDAARAWLPGKTRVAAALAKRFDTDPSGRIIKLEEYAPCVG